MLNLKHFGICFDFFVVNTIFIQKENLGNIEFALMHVEKFLHTITDILETFRVL